MKQSKSILSLKTVEKNSGGRENLFHILGGLALLCVVCLWSFSSYLTATVLDSYEQPFIVTVIGNLSFLSYFIFLVVPDPLIYILEQKNRLEQAKSVKNEEDSSVDLVAFNDGASLKSSASKLPPLTILETARIGFIFFVLYFSSNFLLNFSLGDGDLASISNLVSTSGFFTLLIGYMMGVEVMSALRIFAVLLSVMATVMTVLPSFSFSSGATQAALFALSSAFAYGCYSVYLKVVTRDESRVSMPLLFAFVGLYTLLLLVPILIFCHVWGWFLIPIPTEKVGMHIGINAIFGVLLPSYMWNVAFAFTTPLMVAIGLSFSTPLGIFVGYLKDSRLQIENVIAAFIIIASFFLLNLATLKPDLDASIDDSILSLFKC